jgi:hypothetical protein
MTSTVLAISAPLTELIVVLQNDHFDDLVYNFVFEEPHRSFYIAIDTIHDLNCVGNIGTINGVDCCIAKMTTLTTWSITLFSKSRIEVFISQSTPYMTSTVLAISAPLTELIVVLPK